MTDLGLLSVDSVSAFHGNIQALHDVSLDVGKGEVVAVLGANGAGKSTLLRAIMGIDRINGGSISLRGERIHGRSPHEIVSMGVSFVPEGRRIFPGMTVEENLAVAAPKGRHDASEKEAEVFSLFPSLKERRLTHAGKLSGGEQQMVAIGRALMAGPELLVVDEPSLGLSPGALESTIEALKGLAGEGKSILISEQSPDVALAASDRAYFFENGRVAFSDHSSCLADDPRVMGLYTGRGV